MVPTVRWGEWIGEGWQMFTEQWQAWIVHMLVFFVIMMIPMVPFYVLMFAAGIISAQQENRGLPTVVFAIYPIFYLIVFLLASFLVDFSHAGIALTSREPLYQLFVSYPAQSRFCRRTLPSLQHKGVTR